MSWRTVVIASRAKLDLKLNYLIVRGVDEKKILLDEISTLLIDSTAVSMTAYLLCELAKKKIKVIICDEKRNPVSEMVSHYGSFDTSAKIKQQIAWEDKIKGEVWTEIVRDKIRQQRLLLFEAGLPEEAMLSDYINELKFRDSTNREGHAAKVYFNALFGKGFSRTQDNAVNAGLNYGYSILLSSFNKSIVSAGYITQLGLFHDNIFNHFNLGSDLMEPFRPLIDRCVFNMQIDEFGKEEKMTLVDILNQQVYIGGKLNYVGNAITLYCRSVFNALNDNDISQIRFYTNEL